MLFHCRYAVCTYAKQFVTVLSTISKVAMVPPSCRGVDPELVALCITFTVTMDIF